MGEQPTPSSRPRSFSADSPFSLLGILLAALLGIVLGGVIALLLI